MDNFVDFEYKSFDLQRFLIYNHLNCFNCIQFFMKNSASQYFQVSDNLKCLVDKLFIFDLIGQKQMTKLVKII